MKYKLPGRFGTLSYSGMNTFLGCQRQYAYRYIDKIPVEEVPAGAMDRGRAFHLLAEHQGEVSPPVLLAEVGGNPFEAIKVQSAYRKYRARELSGALPAMQHREIVIRSEELQFYGIVDMIGVKDSGKWMLGELKTTTKLDAMRWSTLPMNTQIALYTAMSGEFAHEQFLALEDLEGVSYRVATMSAKKRLGPTKTKKRPNAETEEEFAERIKDDGEVYHQIVTPLPEAVQSTLQTFESVKEGIHNLAGDSKKAIKNTGNCFAYGRICDYFATCHGFEPHVDEETLDITDDLMGAE